MLSTTPSPTTQTYCLQTAPISCVRGGGAGGTEETPFPALPAVGQKVLDDTVLKDQLGCSGGMCGHHPFIHGQSTTHRATCPEVRPLEVTLGDTGEWNTPLLLLSKYLQVKRKHGFSSRKRTQNHHSKYGCARITTTIVTKTSSMMATTCPPPPDSA